MLESLVVVAVLLSAVALLLGAVLLFRKYGWPVRYLWAIPVIVLLGLGVWWGISSFGSSVPPVTHSSTGWSLEAPAPKAVWEFFKNYWMWMIFILAILFFASDAMPESWAKGAKGMVIVFVVVLVGAMAVHGIWGESSSSPKAMRSEIPLASSPQSEWPKLVIPAGGRSELIRRPAGMKIRMVGDNFLLHMVYWDGKECSSRQMPCPESPIGVYAKNEAMETNIVSYAFVPD